MQEYKKRPDLSLLAAKNYKSLVTVPTTEQVMSYSHMRPQKRKMHSFVSQHRVPKEPKRFLAASTYLPTTLSDNYFIRVLPPLAPRINYDTRAKHPSRLRSSYFPSSIPNHTPTTKHKKANVSNAWLDEWQTEPEQFGSAMPLNLLTEPAEINLITHAHDAERVHLNHWDCDHEPDGAVAQRLALQQKREERKWNITWEDEMREEARRNVRQAAQTARVVDLTRDGTMKDTDVCDYPLCEYGDNFPPLRENEPRRKLPFAISTHDEMLYYFSLYPPAKFAGYAGSLSHDAYLQRRG